MTADFISIVLLQDFLELSSHIVKNVLFYFDWEFIDSFLGVTNVAEVNCLSTVNSLFWIDLLPGHQSCRFKVLPLAYIKCEFEAYLRLRRFFNLRHFSTKPFHVKNDVYFTLLVFLF